ncbi:unnamed protein product, partial [Heterosigma akashiwo]
MIIMPRLTFLAAVFLGLVVCGHAFNSFLRQSNGRLGTRQFVFEQELPSENGESAAEDPNPYTEYIASMAEQDVPSGLNGMTQVLLAGAPMWMPTAEAERLVAAGVAA